MTRERPDPDTLLARVRAEEAQQARGKLKIFFGAAPGVGKTYAMLEAARKEAKAGRDLVIGYVEPHVRPETYALTLGLDFLPRKMIEYRGTTLEEFDLEGALARRPELIIIDELPHTNAPGCTHAKRWQDVDDLLAAGIDVYTTLNVQHLESLNDVVARITGVTVRETVPDSVFESAHEVELVDLPPDDLIERLQEGKVYLPDQAARAVQGFFTRGNLYALRELALRRTAERVNAQLQNYRKDQAIEGTWPTAEKLLVCVGPSPLSARLIRAARRMAAGLRCAWVAVHVETPTAATRDADRDRLQQNLRLAEQLGAATGTLAGADPVQEIVRYAREQNVTKIVVGKPQQPRWRELIRGSFVYELTRNCGDIDVYVISGEGDRVSPPPRPDDAPRVSARSYAWAVVVVALCTVLGWLAGSWFDPVNLVMVYLLGVVVVAVRFGRGPSVLASVLGVAAFDFFFIPPQFTFAVTDTQYFFTFAVMLVTGLVISALTARVRQQVELSRRRERQTAALYGLSRDLATVRSLQEIVGAVTRHVAGIGAQARLYLPADGSRLTAFGSTDAPASERDASVARWAYEHGQPAGLGTGTLPGADALYLPLATATGPVGVLGVRPDQPGRLYDGGRVQLLEAFAGQAAAAVERVNLARDAERVKVEIETERLRNSLLSTVSHDLRTPLAAIAGASSTLLDDGKVLSDETRRELLETILEEAERLNRLVTNLLDVTRIESGALTLQPEWQSVEELVGVVIERLSRQLARHDVRTRLPADLPLVRGDGLLLQQVLLNLLENAAKYSPAGAPIEISARAEKGELVVEVADRGPGLVPGEAEHVFEKFHRSASARGRPGAGLGLTVCKGIMELHGGRIWAEARAGGGSAFRFALPAAEVPAGAVPAPAG